MHYLGNNRKRKAHTWFQPYPSLPIPDFNPKPVVELEVTPLNEEDLDGKKFVIGSGEDAAHATGGIVENAPTWRGGGRIHAPTVTMRCLAWNCRGLHRPTAERTLRGLIRNCNADFLFLSETKVNEETMTSITNRLGFINCSCILASGLAGGFCIAWRRGIICSVKEIYEAGFHVSNWITEKVADCNDPWTLMGDLNVILDESEKEGGRNFNRQESEFLRDFMLNSGGIDLGYDGGSKTWQNSRIVNKRIRKRLDRVVVDSIWCTIFPRACVKNMPIFGSDHAPIFLNPWGQEPKLHYPFKFLEVWTSSPECGEVVDGAWRKTHPSSNEPCLQRKLKVTKSDLKKWNQEKFGFCDRQLESLRRQLEQIQQKPISGSSVQQEDRIQLEIMTLEGQMDKIWRQKSRANWIRFGDANSKFFHVSTIVRRRRNFIGSIMTPVTNAENDLISRVPDDNEIKDVAFKLHPLKSPGPDGFSEGENGVMAIKTDMSKAYDRLEWNFLLRVLKENGFNDKVCTLIMQCVTTVSYSILLNGAPLAPFNPNCGLRQGDPLSPFLFILCSEVLSKLILKPEKEKAISGIRIAHNACPISHLFYADDAIFFCQATVGNASNLMECIQKYENWSGQRPKKCGGLGFRRFKDMNMALLAKLFWMILQGKDKMPWIPRRNLVDIKEHFQFVRNQALWKVRDLFSEGTRSWNENLIRECFDEEIANEILKIKSLQEGPDILFWNASKSGNFSVKSAYWNSQKHRLKDESKIWTKLWKTDIHPRLKLFCWRLFSDILPTTTRTSFIQDTKFQLFVACACEMIWKWRNDIIFNGSQCNVEMVFKDSLRRTTDFTQKKLWQDQVEILATAPTMQQPLDINEFCRVQVDASVVGKEAGFAAVHQQVLPSDSLVSVDFASVEGVFEAELLGIACALQMAISRNFPKVWIETDSKSAALAFEARELPFDWNTFPLFKYYLDLCKSLVDVRVSYIPRQENVCADALARWARISKVKSSGFLREVAPFCGH
uniref:Reverse transcriptase n=1 Tax=Cannabis sativa TaxID=3483 RepID=A0A803NJ15_CANSA